MTIAVLGASGVYARHLIPRLAASGMKVRGLVRRPEAQGLVRALGAEAAVADIFDEQSLIAGLSGCEVCVNLATALPGPSGRGDYDLNDRVRREGVPVLIRAMGAAGVRRLLQQSIAMVSARGDALASEDDVFRPEGEDPASRAIRATIDMENSVTASGLDWAILRGGLFYGPGTGFDEAWFERAREGRLRAPGDGSGYVSLVHIADMAAATAAALERWPSRRALIVADDHPVTWGELFGFIASVCGTEAGTGGRPGFPPFRVANARAKAALSWTPHYSDFRTGLAR